MGTSKITQTEYKLTNAEYQAHSVGVLEDAAQEQNAPCAECDTETRPTLMTIAANRGCPHVWTNQYEGIDFIY